jgi:hypothetical protein
VELKEIPLQAALQPKHQSAQTLTLGFAADLPPLLRLRPCSVFVPVGIREYSQFSRRSAEEHELHGFPAETHVSVVTDAPIQTLVGLIPNPG